MDELKISLDHFKPRDYQKEFFDAIEVHGFKRVFMVVCRRGGKDRMCWEEVIYQMLLKPILVLYALPTFSQARRCIWDAINLDGSNFLDSIDPRLIAKKNEHEMKITLVNGSRLSLIGGDSYNTSLVGSNAYMIILSEASLMDLDNIYGYCRPILAANDGILIIQGTPRGKNAFYHMYEAVKNDPNWFVMFKTVYDTNHIRPDILAREKEKMDPGLFAQEYECSFERGQQGLIYGDALDKMKLDGRFTVVNHDPMLLTHIAIDIGVSDATTIIWFQVSNDLACVRIIDCYSNTGLGLDHYAKIIQDKPYTRGMLFAPHDMEVREWASSAMTRTNKARQLGLDFTVLKQHLIQDGIENVLSIFPKLWINSLSCQTLMDALENYRREWDEEKRVHSPKPVHSWASHYSDAVRYMAAALEHLTPRKSVEEINRIRRQALYGNNRPTLPEQFRRP